ncbi:MAG: hypothetical protein A2189_05725 [Paenibacillus sp. RIFOXYA1_FULL_44_5]|nr:MAG: hypothetical protein A2189_05725 [Paenibacillus sp. RIFOXYA1_FULL_44_5]
MAEKGHELLKYIAERVMDRVQMPREQRRQEKIQLRSKKQPWQYQWFGMLPFSLSMWIKEKKRFISRKKNASK